MSSHATSFPDIPDGDVKIVLSERPEDVLMLNTSVLAKDSAFFKASLERLEWPHNKLVTTDAGKETEHSYKLLELDFDKSNTLPLLVDKSFETISSDLRTARKEHDAAYRYHLNPYERLANDVSDSSAVIAAYKIGFAMMYGLRIDFPISTISTASIVIAVLVDFADAYGLLPAWKNKILALIFGGSCEGYDLIAKEPFHFLKVACRLESKAIYDEAMIYAVAIYDKTYRNFPDEQIRRWLRNLVGDDLFTQSETHSSEFSKKMNGIERRFLHIQPQCCGKIGAAPQIGVAIFRDWIAENTNDLVPNHDAVIKIIEHDYDVADITSRWPPRSANRIVDLKFGHIHRAVENCFNEAHKVITGSFRGERSPRAAPRDGFNMLGRKPWWCAKDRFAYYANVDFAEDYQYPWEKEEKVKISLFNVFEGAGTEQDEESEVLEW